MKLRAFEACVWGALTLALGCAGDSAVSRIETPSLVDPVPWTGLDIRNSPEDFHFVIVSDRTGGHREGVFESALQKINLLQPAFVVSVGDLIEGYTEDRSTLEAEWAEMDEMISRLQMPFFYAAGNHDFSNETMSKLWRDRLGPSYYHFRHQDVLFLVLNSELFSSVAMSGVSVPGPDSQQEQMAYAERVLAEHADARFTFVVIHQPLWDAAEIHPDWLKVEDWLAARPYSVIAGHHHRYTAIRRHDRRFVTLASTGGTSRLRGLDHGEFDHVMWVTLADEGPVYANLMLEGIQDFDVRTHATRRIANLLSSAIEVEPWWVETPSFTEGEARFSLRNPLSTSLEVLAEVRAGRDLVPGFPEARLVLEPGARQELVVPVMAREPMGVGALAPAWIDWTLRAPKANGELTELTARSWILPDRRFPCTPAPSTVRIDGELNEWGALPHAVAARPLPAGGEPLASLHFAVSCDEAAVYVVGEVVDLTPFAAVDRTASDQDAVSILLDGRPLPERDVNENFYAARKSGSLLRMLQAWLTPGQTRADPIVGPTVAALPDTVRSETVLTEDGYRFEIAVPNSWLEERGGEAWDGFRLDVNVQDFDSQGVMRGVQEWRPNRIGFESTIPVAGSGSFLRR